MNTLYSILVSIDVLLAIGIIGLILIQHGKGADVGAAFGSGASGTVFGSQGSASFLTRTTAILATLFFINSLVLAYLASNRPVAESVIDNVEQTEIVAPAADTPKVDTSDVPNAEITVEDVSSERALEADVPDVPTASEPSANDGLNNAIQEVQDAAREITDGVENNLEDVTPDDVPE